jgi:UDP:flavonoid glycosyltransferase YjiC (YdhE family)
MPLTETSKDLPPAGLGMIPSDTFFGRIRQALLRKFSDKMIFHQPNKIMWKIFDNYKIRHDNESLFDMSIRKSDLLLQSGTPGFEYKRSDLGRNIRFIGALLPYRADEKKEPWFDKRLTEYSKVVLVTQGTVEKNIEKLLVPTLEAFENSDTLIVCTTGGSRTQELKDRFPYYNIIIEDFIPFGDVMPYTDVYVTNGGYGGVMLAIENKLPLVVAGLHEGKNEINARVGYFRLGINLNKEKPTAVELRNAINEVLANEEYKQNSGKLAEEFRQYATYDLCRQNIVSLLPPKKVVSIEQMEDVSC